MTPELARIPPWPAQAGGDAVHLVEPALPAPDDTTEWGRAARRGVEWFNARVSALRPADLEAAVMRAERDLGPAGQPLGTVFAAADLLAASLQRRVRRLIGATDLLLLLALVAFGSIDLTEYALFAYLGAVMLVAAILALARVRDVEDRFLDCRALAEGLRVLAAWRLAGVEARVSDRYLARHLRAVQWIRAAIAAIEAATAPPAPDPALVRERWVHGQRDYLRTKAAETGRAARRWDGLGRAALVATLLVAASYAAWLLWRAPDAPDAGPWFQAALGLVGGAGIAAQAHRTKRGFRTLAVQYRLGFELFDRGAALLAAQPDRTLAILERLGDEALRENGEWLTHHRTHPAELTV